VQLAASQPAQIGFASSIALSRMAFLVRAPKIRIEQEITEATKDSKFSPSFSLLSPVKISSEFDFNGARPA
jgi:hypothetical protein